jgi:hypothetical protein
MEIAIVIPKVNRHTLFHPTIKVVKVVEAYHQAYHFKCLN